MIDLAVPRDIDPCIGELPQTEVYNIDDFQTGTGVSEEQSASIEAAKELVEEEVAEFVSWYECHQLADAVEQTAAKVFQKMLFGVRDHADSDVMRECLDALGQVWKKE